VFLRKSSTLDVKGWLLLLFTTTNADSSHDQNK